MVNSTIFFRTSEFVEPPPPAMRPVLSDCPLWMAPTPLYLMTITYNRLRYNRNTQTATLKLTCTSVMNARLFHLCLSYSFYNFGIPLEFVFFYILSCHFVHAILFVNQLGFTESKLVFKYDIMASVRIKHLQRLGIERKMKICLWHLYWREQGR